MQLTGSSEFTLKSLLPVNWQQRIYVKITGSSDFNVNSLLPVKFLFLFWQEGLSRWRMVQTSVYTCNNVNLDPEMCHRRGDGV